MPQAPAPPQFGFQPELKSMPAHWPPVSPMGAVFASHGTGVPQSVGVAKAPLPAQAMLGEAATFGVPGSSGAGMLIWLICHAWAWRERARRALPKARQARRA